MIGQWETLESGPADAERTVLLLPGGLNTARSYAELMAQPGLAGVRLVAVTLPGHGGTPPPEDFRIEHYARLAAELAGDLGCEDRKSTRLNSSHMSISYAVFCLKKKKNK